MLERGSLTVARLRGIPIRLHWTLPFGALVFSGFRFAPGFWTGFVLLVLFHELGHAALVRWFRLRVTGIDITGFGGLCSWSGMTTPLQRGAIAWGGVLAQAILLLATIAAMMVLGRPRSFFAAEIVSVFTFTNVYLIALNLLPIPPLDGWEAWRFVGRLFKGERFAKKSRRERIRPEVWEPPRNPSGWNRKKRETPKKGNGASTPETSKEQLARMLEKVAQDAGKARR
jgi:hypothetical protein